MDNTKEKKEAERLIRSFYKFGINNTPYQSFSIYECKQLALITVDEIINSNPYIYHHDEITNYINSVCYKGYWEEVKKEISSYENNS